MHFVTRTFDFYLNRVVRWIYRKRYIDRNVVKQMKGIVFESEIAWQVAKLKNATASQHYGRR